ncbi:MAG TPA: hypothetical protein PLX71_02160 [Phycicoccus sp.]|nr:hypothetical protein [Phycicoccus sp.]
MKGLGRLVAVCTLVMVSSGVFGVASAQESAVPQRPAADPSLTVDTPSSGAAKFGACLRGKKSADVVLLIDESGSLKDSDPAAQRVVAATHLLNEWKVLAERSGSTINVQTMGFSGATSAGTWRTVGAGSADLVSDVAAFADRNAGQQTDYWMALNGARQSLADHAPSAGTCQAIVWFTDGKLDAYATYAVDGRSAVKPYLSSAVSNAETSTAAAADICRSGGVVDQLRSGTISLFAIGLNAGTSTATDFDLMKSMATGGNSPTGGPCGSVSAAGLGWFKLATDVGDLIGSFDELIVPDGGVVKQTSKICQGAVCTEFAHKFVLDNSLTWVHILAQSKAPDLQLYVAAPGGAPVKVAESFAVGSVKGTSQRYDSSTTNVDLVQPQADWSGQWSLVFVDPTNGSKGLDSQTSISMTTDLTPTLVVPTGAHVGEKVPDVKLGLKRGSGERFDPTTLKGSISVDASLADSAGHVTKLLQGAGVDAFSKPLSLDLAAVSPGRGTISVSATVTTAAATVDGQSVPGTQFKPTKAEYAVDLLPPLGYPTVESEGMKFGAWKVRAPAKLVTALRVKGPGCVWMGESKVHASPQKAGAVHITGLGASSGSATCIKAGDDKEVPLTLSTAAGANGAVNGSLALQIAPTDALGKAKTVEIPYTATLDQPPNVGLAWAAGIAAAVIGLAIPLGLMYVLKWRSAKIKPFTGLLGGELPVTVTTVGVARDGSAHILLPTDLRDPLPLPPAGVRDLQLGRVSVRTETGWSPLAAATAYVSASGMVAVSSVDGTPRKDGRAALPLALHNEWAVLHDPSGPADQALIVLFAGVGGDRAQIEGRLTELGPRVMELVERIRASVGSTMAPDTRGVNPFGDGFAARETATDPFGEQSGFPAGVPSGAGPVSTDPFAPPSAATGAWGGSFDATVAADASPAAASPRLAPAPSATAATDHGGGIHDWPTVPRGSQAGPNPTPQRASEAAQWGTSADPFAIDLSDWSSGNANDKPQGEA